ncbi:MAG: thiamine phosphate synthase, partial [Mobilicoccus sp.]|nr:thiamine phosphate synthase [Mobilicoccus sp.]
MSPRLSPAALAVYLVTDTAQCGARGVVETVRQALEGGVTFVQLRDPDAEDADLVQVGRELHDVLRGTGVPLVVDDR